MSKFSGFLLGVFSAACMTAPATSSAMIESGFRCGSVYHVIVAGVSYAYQDCDFITYDSGGGGGGGGGSYGGGGDYGGGGGSLPYSDATPLGSVKGCMADGVNREQAAWAAYKIWLSTNNPGANILELIAKDQENKGSDYKVMFMENSVWYVGVYERSGGDYRDSAGMIEVKKPTCGE